jgi:hypothetical protein
MFLKIFRQVSNIALWKQLSSASGLTVDKAASAVYLFPE